MPEGWPVAAESEAWRGNGAGTSRRQDGALDRSLSIEAGDSLRYSPLTLRGIRRDTTLPHYCRKRVRIV